jgi:hypothetical protein
MHGLRGGACVLLIGIAVVCLRLNADPVVVRYRQGSAHGFLVLKTLDGVHVATGDVTQSVHGDRVMSRVLFRFRDGSVDDDTTVFSQQGVFRLISDHHIQHGASFPKPVDMLVDATTGRITSRDQDGKVTITHLDLPPDVSNGLPPNLLMNIVPSTPETKLSFIVPGTKPRLIRVSIKPAGRVPFTVGGMRKKAIDYVLHIELGGLAGMIAPLIGKEPPDFHIWILDEKSPAFIREEGQLYQDGPIWRIEQVSPTFAR